MYERERGESEWTEISAARDNRRRQYFNRRQIYRPREMANASNVPFHTSYPLLLDGFLPSNGWRDSKEQASHFTRLEITRGRGALSLLLTIIRNQSTVEEAWSDKKKRKWRNRGEYFVGRVWTKDNTESLYIIIFLLRLFAYLCCEISNIFVSVFIGKSSWKEGEWKKCLVFHLQFFIYTKINLLFNDTF